MRKTAGGLLAALMLAAPVHAAPNTTEHRTMLDTDADNRLDLAVAQPGEDRGAGAVTVLRGENGAFPPASATLVDLAPFRPGGVVRLGRRAAS